MCFNYSGSIGSPGLVTVPCEEPEPPDPEPLAENEKQSMAQDSLFLFGGRAARLNLASPACDVRICPRPWGTVALSPIEPIPQPYTP